MTIPIPIPIPTSRVNADQMAEANEMHRAAIINVFNNTPTHLIQKRWFKSHLETIMGKKWSNKSYNEVRAKMMKDGELELGARDMYKLNGACLSAKTTIMTSTMSSAVASRAKSIALEALPRVTSIKQSIHEKCKTATSSLSKVPFCLS